MRRRAAEGARPPAAAPPRIELLADVPEALATVAEWQFGEWGNLTPGDSIEKRVARLEGHLGRGRVPLTLVALDGPIPVGAANLVATDLPQRADLSPWLSSVFVPPPWRRRGVGTALVGRAVAEAARLGAPCLYLFTWDQERFYRRAGWRVQERRSYRETEIVVMSIETRRQA